MINLRSENNPLTLGVLKRISYNQLLIYSQRHIFSDWFFVSLPFSPHTLMSAIFSWVLHSVWKLTQQSGGYTPRSSSLGRLYTHFICPSKVVTVCLIEGQYMIHINVVFMVSSYTLQLRSKWVGITFWYRGYILNSCPGVLSECLWPERSAKKLAQGPRPPVTLFLSAVSDRFRFYNSLPEAIIKHLFHMVIYCYSLHTHLLNIDHMSRIWRRGNTSEQNPVPDLESGGGEG